MSIDDIAKQDKVKPGTIEESLRCVEAQNQIFGVQSLENNTIEVISHLKDLEKQALEEALTAEKYVYSNNSANAGEVIAAEPDHDTRLRAVGQITEKTKSVMLRHAKGNTQNTHVNVGVGVGVSNGESTNFESRLRDLVKKRQQLQAASENELPVGGEILDVTPEREKLAVDG
jgi:hypothetical protein